MEEPEGSKTRYPSSTNHRSIHQILDSAVDAMGSGEHEKSITSFDQAISLAHDNRDPELEIVCLATKGETIWQIGHLETALNCLTEALNVADNNNLTGLKCDLHRSVGMICHESGNPEKGISNINEAINLASESGDKNRESTLWGSLGVVYLEIGNMGLADQSFGKAFELANKLNDNHACAGYLTNLGIVHSQNLSPETSISYLRQSCQLFKESEDNEGELNALELLIGVLKTRDLSDQLIPALHRALTIAGSLGEKDAIKRFYEDLIETYMKIQKYAEAASTIEDCLPFLDREDRIQERIEYLTLQGHLYFDLEKAESARRSYQQALEFVDKGLGKPEEALVRTRMATIAAESKDFSASEKQISQALVIANDLQNDQLKADLLCVKAINCQERGLSRKAVDFIQKAMSLIDRNCNPQEYASVSRLLEKLKACAHPKPNTAC